MPISPFLKKIIANNPNNPTSEAHNTLRFDLEAREETVSKEEKKEKGRESMDIKQLIDASTEKKMLELVQKCIKSKK